MTNRLAHVVLLVFLLYFKYTKSFSILPRVASYRVDAIKKELGFSTEIEAQSTPRHKYPTSYISEIRSKNLGGLSATESQNDIVIDLRLNESSNSMIVVTGETGSGKSLLVSKGDT